MGGRGARSGLTGNPGSFGGYGTLAALIAARNEAVAAAGTRTTDPGDYTDNDNPALLKYQGQDDDKTARFLAKVWHDTDYADYADGYSYHNNSLQKLILQLGLDAKPTVLSDSDFTKYVHQTGAEVFYRGWGTRSSADRFLNADHTRVGTGVYGDGIYFTPDRWTASAYNSGAVTRMALSPTARVIDYQTLVSRMRGASTNLRNGLSRAGAAGSRSYSPNDGEAQYALKLGYNVVRVDMGRGDPYYFAITRDAFIVSSKY